MHYWLLNFKDLLQLPLFIEALICLHACMMNNIAVERRALITADKDSIHECPFPKLLSIISLLLLEILVFKNKRNKQ